MNILVAQGQTSQGKPGLIYPLGNHNKKKVGEKMTLNEYIIVYRRGVGALTCAEARIVGIGFPLVKDWLRDNGSNSVDLPALLASREVRAKKQAGKVKAKDRKKAKSAAKKEVIKSVKARPDFIPVPTAAAMNNTDHAHVNSDAFLRSFEWKQLRFKALQKYGRKCQCCGATPLSGAVMNVDHVKPRRKFPQLALDIDNLQVLCGDCNHGKGNAVADFR